MRSKKIVNARMRGVVTGMVIALVGTACGPTDDQADLQDDNDTTQALSTEVAAQVDAVRSGVGAALDSLQTEVNDQWADSGDEPADLWTEVSNKLSATRDDVLREMDEIADNGQDARGVRDRAAERIAELEAEVARAEMAVAEDLEALRERTDHRFAELQDNLTELMAYESGGAVPAGATPGANPSLDANRAGTTAGSGQTQTTLVQAQNDLDIDISELRSLQEDLSDAQHMVSNEGFDQDRDFADVRDDLGDAVAELTLDIRKHWHALQWSEAAQ